MQRGIVTVQFDEDTNNMGNIHSVTSVTSSMLVELEAMREENRLLREAMENQSRAQQEIMTRVVGEMATHDRTGLAPTGDQFVERARQMVATDDSSGGQPSHGISDLPGARESLAWGSMGRPTLTENASRSTNPFVTPRHSQEPVRESVSEITGRAHYFAGGDLLDSRYEPWDSWTRRVHGYVSVEQPQPHSWVKDIVSGECHQNLRDHPGYGRWGRCISGYRADEDEESAVSGGHRGMQINDEGVSSDESGSLSRCPGSQGEAVRGVEHPGSLSGHPGIPLGGVKEAGVRQPTGHHQPIGPEGADTRAHRYPNHQYSLGRRVSGTHSSFSSAK